MAGAIALGIVGVATVGFSLVPFIAAGTFILVAYNLELFGGRFHTDFWFAASWGAFPALTAYWANALSIGLAGVLVTGGLLCAERRPEAVEHTRSGRCGGGPRRWRELRRWRTGASCS